MLLIFYVFDKYVDIAEKGTALNHILSDQIRAKYNAQRPKSKQHLVCHAPINSLYFGIGGWVTSCCVNRSFVLGEYPAQTIEDIWKGRRRMEILGRMKTGDLSKGCEVCYASISSGNYAGTSARVYDQLSDGLDSFPKKMDFELSNKCNLECIICRGERSSSIRKNREKLPPIESPYDAEFIRQLEPFFTHIEEAHFLGGEPFLIPIYLDIWEKMIEINPSIKISLQTNCTVLTDRVKRILELLPFSISISIDSIEHNLYAEVRKNGKFDVVLKNMEYFRAYCERKKTDLTISYTPMIKNWKELPSVIEFCNKRSIKVFFNTLSHPRYLALMHMKSSELKQVIEYLEKFDFPSNNGIESANKGSFEDLRELIRYWHSESKKKEADHNPPQYESIDAFFDAFNEYLEKHVERPKEMYIEVRSKVESILTIAEEAGKYQLAEDFIVDLAFEKLVRYVPGVSVEELLISFESGVEQLRIV